MKKILFTLFAALALAAAGHAASEMSDYTALLKKYVTPHGVKYAAWHGNAADLAALKKVVEVFAKGKPGGGRDEKLAFYINAYNANILSGCWRISDQERARHRPALRLFTQSRITVCGRK